MSITVNFFFKTWRNVLKKQKKAHIHSVRRRDFMKTKDFRRLRRSNIILSSVWPFFINQRKLRHLMFPLVHSYLGKHFFYQHQWESRVLKHYLLNRRQLSRFELASFFKTCATVSVNFWHPFTQRSWSSITNPLSLRRRPFTQQRAKIVLGLAHRFYLVALSIYYILVETCLN